MELSAYGRAVRCNTYIAAHIFHDVRLERHVHVDSTDDVTYEAFFDVQQTLDEYRRPWAFI
jgi:hypothetical protein